MQTILNPAAPVKRRQWTADDQSRAEVAAACGVSLREIGRMLGRSGTLVRRKLIPAVAERKREQNRARYIVNPESYRERSRAYYDSNPERGVWHKLIARCTKPTEAKWPRYGGRGISVCPEWLASFDTFLADMGRRPGPGYQIDRIDNDGNYEPGNCRWTTSRENCRNRRNNHNVELMGLHMTLVQACSITGIFNNTARRRLAAGLPPELAFSKRFGRLPQPERERITRECRQAQLQAQEAEA